MQRCGCHRGDEAILFAVAIFEDGGQLGLVWQLHSCNWLDLEDIREDDFNPAIKIKRMEAHLFMGKIRYLGSDAQASKIRCKANFYDSEEKLSPQKSFNVVTACINLLLLL